MVGGRRKLGRSRSGGGWGRRLCVGVGLSGNGKVEVLEVGQEGASRDEVQNRWRCEVGRSRGEAEETLIWLWGAAFWRWGRLLWCCGSIPSLWWTRRESGKVLAKWRGMVAGVACGLDGFCFVLGSRDGWGVGWCRGRLEKMGAGMGWR